MSQSDGIIEDFRKSKKESVAGPWIALIILGIIFGTLTMTVFHGRFQWWMGIPLGILFLLSFIFTIMYFVVKDQRICPNCRSKIPPKAEYCSYCGANVPLYCPNCASKLKPGLKYCSRCGQNLTVQQAPKPPIEHTHTPETNTMVKSGYCPSCGSSIKPETNFCPFCGYKL